MLGATGWYWVILGHAGLCWSSWLGPSPHPIGAVSLWVMGTWGRSWDPDPAPTPQPLTGHHHVRPSVHPCPSQAAFWHGSSPNSLARVPPNHFNSIPPRCPPFPRAVHPNPNPYTPPPLNPPPLPRDPRAPRCPGAPQLSPPLSAGWPQGPRGQLPEGSGGAPAAGGTEMKRGRGHPTGDSGGTAKPQETAAGREATEPGGAAGWHRTDAGTGTGTGNRGRERTCWGGVVWSQNPWG